MSLNLAVVADLRPYYAKESYVFKVLACLLKARKRVPLHLELYISLTFGVVGRVARVFEGKFMNGLTPFAIFEGWEREKPEALMPRPIAKGGLRRPCFPEA